MSLGILMGGGEREFLDEVICAMNQNHDGVYVEVGVAYGQTLVGVWNEIKGLSWQPRVVGIELPEWPARNEIDLRMTGPEFAYDDLTKRATVLLGRSTEVLSREGFPAVACAFIDACHGKPCVMADFLAIEPKVLDGGMVIFHDAGEKEQGVDVQPHCNEPISVRAALFSLGLIALNLDYKVIKGEKQYASTRPGWSFVGMLPTENQCAVFQKVKTTLGKSDTVNP